nr:hypothetical protein [Desulfobacula sp.]
MYWISVTALGAFVYFYLKGRKKNEPGEVKDEPTEKASEKGRVPDPEMKNLHTPAEMLKALKKIKTPWERHLGYIQCLEPAYKKRAMDQKMRDLSKDLAQAYVKEFSELKAAVFEKLGEDPKEVIIFKQLAILFEEDREYEKAIDVCRNAIALGLSDGTKTGYEGRLERLGKKLKARLNKGGDQ